MLAEVLLVPTSMSIQWTSEDLIRGLQPCIDNVFTSFSRKPS